MPELPALPDAPDANGAITLERVRATIALLTVDDLPDLATDTKRLAALAAAAQRVTLADGAELDWSEAARTAERRLGQLLVEGREQGTVAKGRGFTAKASAPTLDDLDLGVNLAADAVALAELPEAAWLDVLAQGRLRRNLGRGPLATVARRYLAERDAAVQRIADAEREATDLLAEAKRRAQRTVDAARRTADLLAERPLPPAPDLDPLPLPRPLEEQIVAEGLAPRSRKPRTDREMDALGQQLDQLTERLVRKARAGCEPFDLAHLAVNGWRQMAANAHQALDEMVLAVEAAAERAEADRRLRSV